MNKHPHQKGFSAVEIILVIVVIGLLGFVGWKIYESQTTPAQPATSQQTQNNPTYTTDTYTFEYPMTWTASDARNQENTSDTYAYSTTYSCPDYATSEEGIGFHLTDGARIYVSVQPTDAATADAYFASSGFLASAVSDKKAVTVDGAPGLSYQVSWEASHSLTTIVLMDDKLYSLSMDFADTANRDAYKQDYDAFVASFKFIAQ